jgi:hypothetical protein
MDPPPKKVRWQLNQLVGQAYENELSRELEKLATQFDEWRAGRIGSGELAHTIHKYDTGPLRELYKTYNNNPDRELLIASALQRGLLHESDVPEEAWPYLQNAIAFIQANVGEDNVDDD